MVVISETSGVQTHTPRTHGEFHDQADARRLHGKRYVHVAGFAKDIVQTARDNGKFRFLVVALKEAGLVETLKGKANVTKTDIVANNGVIHVIGTVVLPSCHAAREPAWHACRTATCGTYAIDGVSVP